MADLAELTDDEPDLVPRPTLQVVRRRPSIASDSVLIRTLGAGLSGGLGYTAGGVFGVAVVVAVGISVDLAVNEAPRVWRRRARAEQQ